MAVAYVQEFEIKDGDTSTTNYDAVIAALGLTGSPAGLLIHSQASTMTQASSASSMSGSRASRASASSRSSWGR